MYGDCVDVGSCVCNPEYLGRSCDISKHIVILFNFGSVLLISKRLDLHILYSVSLLSQNIVQNLFEQRKDGKKYHADDIDKRHSKYFAFVSYVILIVV